MAYGSTNNNKTSEEFDKHLKLENKLDSHKKPIKIGDDVTGLQLADKDVKVENDLTVGKDLTINGDTISTAGNITLDSGGSILLDSETGIFITKNSGTEFSAENSAYAGMILGYTRIQNDGTSSGEANITVNSSSMTVLATAHLTELKVTFVAPPSGNVEIQCSFWLNALSDGVKFALSDNASFNEVDETHTYDADQTIYLDETDHNYNTILFSESGLTAGTEYTRWIAGLASGGGVNISHGRNRTGGTHFPPIIIKAIALPSTITTGE